MAQQGLDPTFGLEATCSSHAAGLGGWPLAAVVGIDGRIALACASVDVPPADRTAPTGARQLHPPIEQACVAALPADGRTFGPGLPASYTIAATDPEANDSFLLGRAIAHPDRITVLGTRFHGQQQTLALQTFQATRPVGGWQWTAGPRRRIGGAPPNADHCALGWLDTDPVVVVPQGYDGATLQLLVYGDSAGKSTVQVPVPAARLDLSAGFTVDPWVTSVVADRHKQLMVGVSWVALDPAKGRRPVGAIDESRACVLRLRRAARGWRLDNTFSQSGLWIATRKDGEITTAEHLAVTAKAVLFCVGRAAVGGARSLFAASLDTNGKPRWRTHPAPGAMQAPTGLALDAAGRMIICGSSRPFDMNYPVNDPAEAVVVCLSPSGQLDAAFAAGGIARFRSNGATYATAVTAAATGELLVCSLMRWGENGVGRFQPCVTRLTPAGSADAAFGLGGVARQDGLGGAEIAAVDASGRVWSAGVGKTHGPGSSWLPYLAVARLAGDGGLENGFGPDGIANVKLQRLDARLDSYSVDSLVPLASGGAILAGGYVPIAGQTGGAWVARLADNGALDATFGSGGVRVYQGRSFRLVAELAPSAGSSFGQLQGWEKGAGGAADRPLRLAADGAAAPGFGANGINPVNGSIVLPADYEADGEWFAPILDAQRINSIGLVRCAADGTIDPNFGAGAAIYDPAAYVQATAIQRPTPPFPALNPSWDVTRHRTFRLADGTYLTLCTATWQEASDWFDEHHNKHTTITLDTPGLALIAWTANGMPRPAWGAPAKAIRNPLGLSILGGNWIGWRYRCAQLQADGSLLVGVEGEDAARVGSYAKPKEIRTSAYFARLSGATFDVDAAFGGGGHVVRRLPGEDRRDGFDPNVMNTDYQSPAAVQELVGGAVVAAVRPLTVAVSAQGNTQRGSPDLLADGSVGMVRLT